MNMIVKYPECTVLIVDDEPGILSILSSLMKGIVGRILTAENGHAALDIARKNNIDVVLLDLKMPKMGGLECLRELKRINPDIVSAFLTGYANEASVREALRLGAMEFLDKPIVEADLMLTVVRCVELSLVRQERRKILEALLYEYTDLEKEAFDNLQSEDQVKFLRTVREILEMKLLRKQNIVSHLSRN